MNGHERLESILDGIEYISVAIEILAVAIIAIGISWATYSFLAQRGKDSVAFRDDVYRKRLGRTLLLGLEVLVAADVIRTVALEPTLKNVGILGLLVVIRTFLSWSLVVEIEHRWPWQRLQTSEPEASAATEARAASRRP